MAKKLTATEKDEQVECVICRQPAGARPRTWTGAGPDGVGLCGGCRHEWRGDPSNDVTVLSAYLESLGASPGAILADAVIRHREAERDLIIEEAGCHAPPEELADDMRRCVVVHYQAWLKNGLSWRAAARKAMAIQWLWGPDCPARTREVLEARRFRSPNAVKMAASRAAKAERDRVAGVALVKLRAVLKWIERDNPRVSIWKGDLARVGDLAVERLLPAATVAELEAAMADEKGLVDSGADDLLRAIMREIPAGTSR